MIPAPTYVIICQNSPIKYDWGKEQKNKTKTLKYFVLPPAQMPIKKKTVIRDLYWINIKSQRYHVQSLEGIRILLSFFYPIQLQSLPRKKRENIQTENNSYNQDGDLEAEIVT